MGKVPTTSALTSEGALVIGGDYRALGVVRSLGRRGLPVWILTNEHLVAAVSRYTKRVLSWPYSEEEQLHLLSQLRESHGLNGWAIFPSDDEAAAFLARHHSELSRHFRLTTPSWELMRWSYDKRLTYRIAAEAGIDQPRTFFPTSLQDVARLDCEFPVILKPAFKQDVNAFTYAKAWRADSHADLLTLYEQACHVADPGIVMIQEFIPGGGEEQFSFAALCRSGRVQVCMTAKRRRQYPVDFGRASSFVETIDAPEIEEPSRRLLSAMDLTGLVEVEYKRHPLTGAYQLLDVNSRVWGWLTLGERAGLDFPYLMWKMIHEEQLPELRARVGVRWVRMLMDLPAAAIEMRRGRLTVRDYLKSFKSPVQFAVFASDDLLPALLDAPFLAWLGLKRKMREMHLSPNAEKVKC